MKYDDLINSRRIYREEISGEEVRQAMALAERDLRAARKIMQDELDWGFAVGYNAVLQASRAYMFAKGYRPASAEAHKNTLAFMALALGRKHEALVMYFDRMRVKRHRAVYDQPGLITRREADDLLARAEDFVALVRERIGMPELPDEED